MKIESIAENSLLYDFYGQLLSKRQQEVMALYHEENLSLSEIDTRIDCMISDLTREGESQGTADTAEIVLKLKEIKAIINELE